MAEQQIEQQPAPQVQSGTGKKGKMTDKWVPITLLALFLISLGLLVSLWISSQDKQQNLEKKNQSLQGKVDELQKQLKAEKAKSASAEDDMDEAASCPEAGDELMSNIEDVVISKNYAALAEHMTDPLTVVYAASEFGGPMTPDEAVEAMDFLNNATGDWDFTLADDVLASYEDGDYDQYFSDTAYVGKSADGLVVSFDFECGEIDQVFISASDEIL